MTTALFLGRFQPPHIGHLLTIRALAKKYHALIVGVTDAEPSVMAVSNVIDILNSVLTDKNISFLHVPGSVEEGTAVIDCKFDVCCSGNPAVLTMMAAKGHPVQFTERSLDTIYSGTRIRQAYVENAQRSFSSLQQKPLAELSLVKVESLRPIEKINPRHFEVIEQQLSSSGIMLKPLIVDKITLAVLDGSHRYAYLLKNGYMLAPVILCDYDDESIFVGNNLKHRFVFDSTKWISKGHVRSTAISGKLYPPRTTRHFFPFRKEDFPTELSKLHQGGNRKIDNLLAEVTVDDEISSNDGYISEIKTELGFLRKYIHEQAEVIRWLKMQNAFILENDGIHGKLRN